MRMREKKFNEKTQSKEMLIINLYLISLAFA